MHLFVYLYLSSPPSLEHKIQEHQILCVFFTFVFLVPKIELVCSRHSINGFWENKYITNKLSISVIIYSINYKEKKTFIFAGDIRVEGIYWKNENEMYFSRTLENVIYMLERSGNCNFLGWVPKKLSLRQGLRYCDLLKENL